MAAGGYHQCTRPSPPLMATPGSRATLAAVAPIKITFWGHSRLQKAKNKKSDGFFTSEDFLPETGLT